MNHLFQPHVKGVFFVNLVLLLITWFPIVQILHSPPAVIVLFAILGFTSKNHAITWPIQFVKNAPCVLLGTLQRPTAPPFPILFVSRALPALLENTLSHHVCTRTLPVNRVWSAGQAKSTLGFVKLMPTLSARRQCLLSCPSQQQYP